MMVLGAHAWRSILKENSPQPWFLRRLICFNISCMGVYLDGGSWVLFSDTYVYLIPCNSTKGIKALVTSTRQVPIYRNI